MNQPFKQSLTKPDHFNVEIRRFKELGKDFCDRITRLCPPAGQDRPAYVIYAESREKMDHTYLPAVISYQGAASALFFPRSPVTLASRGEINHLAPGSVYFVPEDRAAKIRMKKIYAAAACLLIALSASLIHFLGKSELPDAYFDLALGLPAELSENLYASGDAAEATDFSKKRDAYIAALLSDSNTEEYYHFEEIIPFYEAVINDERLSQTTRKDAFQNLLNAALHHGKVELILKYRTHPEAFIRDKSKGYIEMNPEKFEEAGIDLDK